MCFVNKRKIIFKKIKSGKDYFESDEKQDLNVAESEGSKNRTSTSNQSV